MLYLVLDSQVLSKDGSQSLPFEYCASPQSLLPPIVLQSMASPSSLKGSLRGDDEKAGEQWIEEAQDPTSSQENVVPYQPGSEAEKRLLRKLDMRIIVSVPAGVSLHLTYDSAAMLLDLVPSWVPRSSQYRVRLVYHCGIVELC